MFHEYFLVQTHYAQLVFIYSTYNMQKIICGGLQHPIEGEELGSVRSWYKELD